MRKPLAKPALKNRLGLLPVGLDAIVLRSLRLFCEFKKVINCLFKSFFGMRYCFGHIKLKASIPICFSCCFIIILGCNQKPSSEEKRQEIFKVINSSVNLRYGLPDFCINFIRGEIQFNRRINTFEFGINNILELLGSSKVISPSVTEESKNKSNQSTEKPTRPDRERKEKVNEICHDFLNAAIFVVIIMSPFFDVPLWFVFFTMAIWFWRL